MSDFLFLFALKKRSILEGKDVLNVVNLQDLLAL